MQQQQQRLGFPQQLKLKLEQVQRSSSKAAALGAQTAGSQQLREL